MTEDVLKAVKTAMAEREISQVALARLTRHTATQTSRIFTGKSTQIPIFWKKVLDHLGLRLIAVPKDARVTISRTLKEESRRVTRKA
jgi:hypothetical protein